MIYWCIWISVYLFVYHLLDTFFFFLFSLLLFFKLLPCSNRRRNIFDLLYHWNFLCFLFLLLICALIWVVALFLTLPFSLLLTLQILLIFLISIILLFTKQIFFQLEVNILVTSSDVYHLVFFANSSWG